MSKRALLSATVFFLGSLTGAPTFAADKTVTLDVPGMTCSMCPITVKHALQRVPGVIKAEATFEPKQAVVTYDDTKTNPEALTEATAWAGYPSTVKNGKKAEVTSKGAK